MLIDHYPSKHLLRLGRQRWARTLWLVYEIDALQCKRCKRQLRQLAVITAPDTVARILKHLGQRETPLIPLPARAPPELSSTKDPAPGYSSNQDKHQPFDPCLDALPKDEWYFIDPIFDDE